MHITPTKMNVEEHDENKLNDANKDENPPVKKVRRQATQEQLDHPLHGVKLAEILESLVENYGWEYLAREVNIMCFKVNPTMKVSLKFLRRMQWAREHVEDIYIRMVDAGIDPKGRERKKVADK